MLPEKNQNQKKSHVPRAGLNDSTNSGYFQRKTDITSGSQKPCTVNYHSAIRTLKFKAPSDTFQREQPRKSGHDQSEQTEGLPRQGQGQRLSVAQTRTESFRNHFCLRQLENCPTKILPLCAGRWRWKRARGTPIRWTGDNQGKGK